MKKIRTLDWQPDPLGEEVDESAAWYRAALQAKPVATAYGKQLRAVELPKTASNYLRVLVRSDKHAGDMYFMIPGDSYMEHLFLPANPAHLDLPEPERTAAFLDWIHDGMMRLARARGWPLTGLEAAAARTRAALGLPGGDPNAQADPDEVVPELKPSDQFWGLIATLGGSIDADKARALAAHLRDAGTEAIQQFETDLQLALAELDTRAHARRRITDSSSDVAGITMSDDLFEYARLAVIAAGYDEWRRVADNPKALSEDRPVFDGEHLSLVVYHATE